MQENWKKNNSIVNISDIPDNSDFNIVVEATGVRPFKENSSNNLTNLSKNSL